MEILFVCIVILINPLGNWVIQPVQVCSPNLRGDLTNSWGAMIEKSIKVFLNEKYLRSGWITQEADGAQRSVLLWTWFICKKKNYIHPSSDTAWQYLHFISEPECIYLQFYQSVAPSKLKSNITAAESFCCFCKIRWEEAACRDGAEQDHDTERFAEGLEDERENTKYHIRFLNSKYYRISCSVLIISLWSISLGMIAYFDKGSPRKEPLDW